MESKILDQFINRVRPMNEAKPDGPHKRVTIEAAREHMREVCSAFATINRLEDIMSAPFVEPVAGCHMSIKYDVGGIGLGMIEIVYVIGDDKPMCARVVNKAES